MEAPITLIFMNENRLIGDEYIEKPTKKYREHEIVMLNASVPYIVEYVRPTFVICRAVAQP